MSEQTELAWLRERMDKLESDYREHSFEMGNKLVEAHTLARGLGQQYAALEERVYRLVGQASHTDGRTQALVEETRSLRATIDTLLLRLAAPVPPASTTPQSAAPQDAPSPAH